MRLIGGASMTAPPRSGEPLSSDIDASLGVQVVPQTPDPAAALKAVMQPDRCGFGSAHRSGFSRLKIDTDRRKFYKSWQGRSARNARETRAEALEARAVHGVAADGVLHPPELVNQTGHDLHVWPLVIVKELIDNALDACEEAEIAPTISITVTKGGSIIIEDNGPGIPAKTIQSVLDYAIRVSSTRSLLCSPTRGQQGNALKTILPMGYVMDDSGEDACGETIIEAHGLAHRIAFEVDHIKQEPKITHTTKPSKVVKGTRITVTLPKLMSARLHLDISNAKDVFWSLPKVLCVAQSASDSQGQMERQSPHQHQGVESELEKMAAVVANVPALVRCQPLPSLHGGTHCQSRAPSPSGNLFQEFRGMTGTAKQKKVLAEIGASHVSLHNYFGPHKANTKNIKKMLASLKRHTKPVGLPILASSGKSISLLVMEAAGGDPKTFKYIRRIGETDGVPRVVEFAFGIHRDGSYCRESAPEPKLYHRRELVSRHQQSVSVDWKKRRWSRRDSRQTSAPVMTHPSSVACMSLVRVSPTPTGANPQSSSKARRTTMAKNKNHGHRHHRCRPRGDEAMDADHSNSR